MLSVQVASASWRVRLSSGQTLGIALGCAVCGLLPVRSAFAAALTSQSSVGISAEYSSNPYLLETSNTAAESLAAVATLPATYTNEAQTLELIPSLRTSLNHGDVAALSDFENLDGDWRLNGERNQLTLGGIWHNESTLYQPFETAALRGNDLRRKEQTGTGSWQRLLSERSDLQFSVSWDKVAYSESTAAGLSSYTYSQGSAGYDYNVSERWKWSTSAGTGRYLVSGGSYSSDSRFVQTSLSGSLSELWTLSLQGGYDDLTSTALEPQYQLQIGPNGVPQVVLVYVPAHAQKGGGNYALSLTRRGERAELDLTASQAVQPSGLGALVTEQDLSAKLQYPWTERLSVSGNLHGAWITDSLRQIIPGGRRIEDVDLSLTWKWTEKLDLQLTSTYLAASQGPGLPVTHGVTVYLNLLRQFGITRL